MDDTKLKELILQSGIPLEKSVSEKLYKYGIDMIEEGEYERDNKIFSTDINAIKTFKINNELGLRVNFVIECKYKKENHGWFFFDFSAENKTVEDFRSHGLNCLYDEIYNVVMPPKTYPLIKLRNENFGLDVVNKGVDICEQGPNESQILEAIYQSILGTAKAHFESCDLVASCADDLIFPSYDESYRTIPVAALSLPIIVTTAEINILKENLTLEKIKSSEKTKELFKSVPGVNLLYSSIETKRFYREVFKKNPIEFSSEVKTWHKKLTGFNLGNWSLWSAPPERVFIINYEHFDEAFKGIIERISQILEESFKKPYKSIKGNEQQ